MSMAAVLRELMAAGLEGDALVSAVERIEAAHAPERTSRQNRNARYYEAHKDEIRAKASERRLKASEASENRLNSDAPPLPLDKAPPHPPKTQPLTPSHTQRAGARATGFPSDFQPNATDLACFAEQGITDPAEQAKTIAHWRDHHVGKGNVFKDWHASLRTWLRSPLRVQQAARPPPVNGYHARTAFERRPSAQSVAIRRHEEALRQSRQDEHQPLLTNLRN